MKIVNKGDPRKFFMATKTTNALVIDMLDTIGESWFGEGTTAGTVRDALAEGADCPSVMLNINSPGGDCMEATAIYHTLKSCGKPVNVNVIGLCASAASLIAMAGTTITMQLGTSFMLHEAQGGCMGPADDMRKMGDVLDTVTGNAADIYALKSKLPKDEVLALMKAETWFSPEQAKAKGFATAVSKDQAKVITSLFDLKVFKNVPVELVKPKEDDPIATLSVTTEVENKEQPTFDSASLRLKMLELKKRKQCTSA